MVTNNQQSVNHIVGNGNNAGNKANNQLWIEVKTQ